MGLMWLHLITTSVLLSYAFVVCELTDGPPNIEIFPQNQTVKDGGIAVFVCTGTGSPNLQIKWTRSEFSEWRYLRRYKFRHDTEDEQESFRKIPIFETICMTNGLMLRVHALGEEIFDCVVGNGIDEPVRATAQLNVISRNHLPSGFPQIAPQNTGVQHVSRGHSVLLPCLVTGDPKPTIRWLKDKLPLNMSIPRYSLFEEQFLQISDAKEADEGEYECIADNSVGSAYSTKIDLLVSERLVSPYFAIRPKEAYKSRPGSSLNITCLANGSPQPSVKWIKDSTVISPNRNGLNVLELTDLQESIDNYTCVASSEMGDAKATVRVITRMYPIAPTNLRVLNVTATCVELSWSYDEPADDKTWYIITCSAPGGLFYHSMFRQSPHRNEKRTLCRLSPNTEFKFYITARNEVGDGPPSSTVIATTKGQ